MSTYWPWWAGALGLALVTVLHTVVTGRSLGISSAWDRVLHWRRERRIERLEEEFTDEKALADALAAATAEHFGTVPAAPAAAYAPQGETGPAPWDEEPAPPAAASAANQRPAPLFTQAALLVSVFVGGLIAAVTSGRFDLRLDMGPGFRDMVTADPWIMTAVLFAGGVLVGFGTRLAGGCSSGHGLSGCGRLRPVSIVATAVFFGTASAVSFLLWKVI
ncbi:YeeE/YedE family protein [Streptomyces meridianus]|uniref:YeeE/YedE family protein n=1 Tax=Streptomyces meridianus TaxID=2938945 RepID=A0ABT0XA27_9ACTN|nr:YeeE/YedE thiosulfate transporter family protein [Streptomyces meridianus]MCM2579376.1 YeeE/YedE family protein [Streptomyces meridianus]